MSSRWLSRNDLFARMLSDHGRLLSILVIGAMLNGVAALAVMHYVTERYDNAVSEANAERRRGACPPSGSAAPKRGTMRNELVRH